MERNKRLASTTIMSSGLWWWNAEYKKKTKPTDVNGILRGY